MTSFSSSFWSVDKWDGNKTSNFTYKSPFCVGDFEIGIPRPDIFIRLDDEDKAG